RHEIDLGHTGGTYYPRIPQHDDAVRRGLQVRILGPLVRSVEVEHDGGTAVGPKLARCRRPLEYCAARSERTAQHNQSTLVQERIVERAQAGMWPWLGIAHTGSDFGHRPSIAQGAIGVQQRLQYGQQSGDAAGMVKVL